MRVAGKTVLPVELYEARTLRDATSFRARRFIGNTAVEELHPPATLLDVRALLAAGGRVLVYGVAPSGRSVCITPRVLAIHDAAARGEIAWNYPRPPAAANDARTRRFP